MLESGAGVSFAQVDDLDSGTGVESQIGVYIKLGYRMMPLKRGFTFQGFILPGVFNGSFVPGVGVRLGIKL